MRAPRNTCDEGPDRGLFGDIAAALLRAEERRFAGSYHTWNGKRYRVDSALHRRSAG